MKKLEMDQLLDDHFKRLNIKENDNLIVHANLSSFGIIKNKKLSQIIINKLIQKIGKNGSIVMPLYNFGLKKNKIYDNKKIHKKGMSVLYLEFFKNYSIYKSKSLMHRHIGRGNDAKCLLKTKPNASLGYKSDFYYLLMKNFNLLLLGCNASEGATYLHHLEALAKVPYRKWIKIKVKLKKNNKIKNQVFNYYSRKNDKYVENFDYFFSKINKKLYKSANLRLGSSKLISLKNLHKIGIISLKKNKYCLVKKNELSIKKN